MSLKNLRARAEKIGVLIDTQRDDDGWAYWLLDAKTRDGVWVDDNFCTDLDEVETKLNTLEQERSAK